MRRRWINWHRTYAVRSYVRDALWLFPALGTVAALLVAPVIDRIDASLTWDHSADTGMVLVLLGTIASAMFTFIVFVCSSLLVVVQLASAQLTPRIIGLMFRDPVMKSTLTVFTFTFTYGMTTLVRVNGATPHLATRIAAYGFMISLCLFLYLVGHIGTVLKAHGALRNVGRVGRDVIEAVYQRHAEPRPAPQLRDVLRGTPICSVIAQKAGSILAFDAQGLLELATRHDCVIEVVPRVGDFVAAGDPLFNLYHGGQAISADALRDSIVIGRERTFEQDPGFALRIIVDIAIKALSPAINDPTTAVLALDEVHYLLRTVGQRQLDDRLLADREGNYRLAYHTPNWDDFLRLAVTEIRQFGATSVQVSRRLRAMLENLVDRLPEARAPALRRELSLLDRTVQRSFAEADDRSLAGVPDPQGVGSRHDDDAADSRSTSPSKRPSAEAQGVPV